MSIDLAVRLPNWVGDVLMALPTLHALADADIVPHCCGRPWCTDLLRATAWPLYPLPRSRCGEARLLRDLPGRHGLLLTNSFGTALAMRLAGRCAIGYRGDWRAWLLSEAVHKGSGRHEVERFWELGRIACGHLAPTAIWPDRPPATLVLPLDDAQRADAAAVLQQAHVTRPFTVLCPLATGTNAGRSKIWPHWTALDAALHARGRRCVVCPGPGENDACHAAVPNAVVLPGLPLGTYAAVCAVAAQVIANDSGPMHLAAAIGAPTLGIFGVGDPQRTRPWGQVFVGSAAAWPTLDEVLSRL